MIKGATAKSATDDDGCAAVVATRATPPAHSNTHTCAMRSAPKRSMNAPLPRLPTIDPT
jgi:hypothetical protein